MFRAVPPFLLLFILATARPANAQEDGQKVYRQTLRSTVVVLAPGDDPRDRGRGMSQGSGALISLDDGLVLTNYHVVGDKKEAMILFPMVENGQIVAERDRYIEALRKNPALGLRGRIVARDSKCDLALIQVAQLPESAVALKLARDGARPGDRVHSVGNPGQSDALWLYTSGTVRQVYHKKWTVRDGGRLHPHEARVVETQSPTNPGDSGGPLVNDQGELVGVTQGLTTNAQLLSVFIDVSEVRKILADKDYRYFVGERRPESPASNRPKDGAASAQDSKNESALVKLQQGLKMMQANRHAEAREAFKEIIEKHPKSPYINEAKALLETLRSK